MSTGFQALQQPISDADPCGEDLEDTQLLASLDGYRLFGRYAPLEEGIPWREIRDQASEALTRSKDFRLLAHYGAAVLRTEGLGEFFAVLQIADEWLESYWDLVYPRIDDDAVLRKNALSCLADRMAMVDALRRTPMIVSRPLGAFSMRDIDIATGQLRPAEPDAEPATLAQITAALESNPLETTAALEQQMSAAVDHLINTARTMQSRGGAQAGPDFEPLTTPLARTLRFLREYLHTRQPQSAVGNGEARDTPARSANGGQLPAGGAITSRQEALLALDAVAEFFRNNEPSSPVPLLLERAKKLVSKNFLEVLEDIAPEGLARAKLIGGIPADTE